LSEDTRSKIYDYPSFKSYQRTHKDTFRDWFIENILAGAHKERFDPRWVSEALVRDALIYGSFDVTGHDPQDGLAFLLGIDNLNNQTLVKFSRGGVNHQGTFQQLLCDGNFASMFLMTLEEKHEADSTKLKRILEQWKANARYSTDVFFKSDDFKRVFFEDGRKMDEYQAAIDKGVPGASNEETADKVLETNSPTKGKPVVQEVEESPNGDLSKFPPPFAAATPSDDEGEGQGEDEEESTKGGRQKKMTDYFGSEV
jgi:hypothetical protein